MNHTIGSLDCLVQRLPAAVLLLATLPIAACAPICDTVNFWSACYSNIHGDDVSAVPSEIGEPPAAEYADAVDLARALVRTYLVEQNVPGLSVAVNVAGEIVWAEGFGWADINSRQPVTPTTRFRIGSVAMPMTAAAVGILLERDELDIDQPTRSYIPSFPEKRWPFTTRQLMGHVAGVGRPIGDDEMLYRRDSCTTARDALAVIADDPQRFEPGTRFEYSIYGWTLVGAVLETVAGRSFLGFMQQEIFDPLGMADTVLDNRVQSVDGTTSFYWPFAATDTTTGIENANNPDNSCLQGAAALLSTPSDVVRFGAAMLDGHLITTETLEMLRMPVVLASGESTGYGLGWSVRQISVGRSADPTMVFGHYALSAGGTASFITIPEHDLVIAATANVSHARNLTEMSDRLADVLVTNR